MSRTHYLLVNVLALVLTACVQPTATTGGTEIGTPISVTAVSNTVSVVTGGPIVITAVGPGQGSTAYIAPTLTPIPTLPGGLGPTELKYRVLAAFPDFFFCDPDFYPIARADEMDLARQRFPELQADSEEFNTILAHNSLTGVTTFSAEQKLLIYREHKKLAAMHFEIVTAGYQFQIQIAQTKGQGELITGIIDGQGSITVQDRKSTIATCPICLASNTLIDTPDGPIQVQALRVGMVVWTLDGSGARVKEPLIQVGKTVVQAGHPIIHLVLDDGRSLWVSPGHPTADGQVIGQLAKGDLLDGARVVLTERVAYADTATYDILPDGDTGYYWANGILMGSTLHSISRH